jgi:hypothetical protein
MNLLKTPEQDFTDLEQRLRSTYAHVASEQVFEHHDPSMVLVDSSRPSPSRRRGFGVWTPRIATVGAVAAMAFAGLNLANRGPGTAIASGPSVFKSFPHVVPTAPVGYRLGGVNRQLTPLIPGFRTEYRAVLDRMPVSLVVGGVTFKTMRLSFDTKFVGGRTVLVMQNDAILMVEVADKKCGTIAIYGVIRSELAETIKNLRCGTSGAEPRAELRNRKRSDIVFSGRLPQPQARLQFHFGSVREPDYFEITTEPCQCENFGISNSPSVDRRVIAGQQVMVAPETAPDGSRLERKTVIWAPTPNSMFTLDSPLDWDLSKIEAVIRGVKEVDQATFTALLESNGIREVSLVP